MQESLGVGDDLSPKLQIMMPDVPEINQGIVPNLCYLCFSCIPKAVAEGPEGQEAPMVANACGDVGNYMSSPDASAKASPTAVCSSAVAYGVAACGDRHCPKANMACNP